MSEYITIEQARVDTEEKAPGIDGYRFQDDDYCPDCARNILDGIEGDFPMPEQEYRDPDNAPAPLINGASDKAHHCEDCGVYLYGGD